MYLDTVMDCFILDIKVPKSQQTVGDLQFSHFSVARLDAVSEHYLHRSLIYLSFPPLAAIASFFGSYRYGD